MALLIFPITGRVGGALNYFAFGTLLVLFKSLIFQRSLTKNKKPLKVDL
jgi:hypothetical protein|tara:strand:+ start:215 stop:361 length:147 start_codon:yes stop_codon:yes gene_type:complete